MEGGFFLWRVEFFKIGKRDFTFIREMRVYVYVKFMGDFINIIAPFYWNEPILLDCLTIVNPVWYFFLKAVLRLLLLNSFQQGRLILQTHDEM